MDNPHRSLPGTENLRHPPTLKKARLAPRAPWDEHQRWGGYPPVWQRKEAADKIAWLKDYRNKHIERDIADVGQVANVETFFLTQRLLCSRTAQILSISEVARDVSLSVNTVKRYINLLSMTFQCHLLHPYFENVGKRFIKSPKIYSPDTEGVLRCLISLSAMSTESPRKTFQGESRHRPQPIISPWDILSETSPCLTPLSFCRF